MTPPRTHPPGSLPRPGVRAANVHVEHSVDEIVGGVDRRARRREDRRVVDPDVEAAQFADGAIGRSGQRCGVGHVELAGQHSPSRAGQLVSEPFGGWSVEVAGDHTRP